MKYITFLRFLTWYQNSKTFWEITTFSLHSPYSTIQPSLLIIIIFLPLLPFFLTNHVRKFRNHKKLKRSDYHSEHGRFVEYTSGIYTKWNKLFEMVLICSDLSQKGKISHLLGTGSKVGDPKFDIWDEEDSMVISKMFSMFQNYLSTLCLFKSLLKI